MLCVTHLPQVASQSDQQLRVEKHVTGGVTRTRLEILDASARIEEIARMLGGATVTARTREHAREMLETSSRHAATNGSSDRAAQRPVSRAVAGAGKPRGRNARAKSASDR